MKPVTIILLMGVAALAGGLLVRYSAHPAVIATSTGVPPKVVAPPLAPSTPLPVAASQPVPEKSRVRKAVALDPDRSRRSAQSYTNRANDPSRALRRYHNRKCPCHT